MAEEAGFVEDVYKILTVQQIRGIEDNFLVQLQQDGQKVRVSTLTLYLHSQSFMISGK